MPNEVFDGLADIFVDTLGEPVIYTPAAGSPSCIQAIWTEVPMDVQIYAGVMEDAGKTMLSVRAADVVPVEGDTARRVADGKTMNVTTPIMPDGKGMIMCNLADAHDAPAPGFTPSLDFSDPRNSQYLALFGPGAAAGAPGAFSLDFSIPANSGYVAAIGA